MYLILSNLDFYKKGIIPIIVFIPIFILLTKNLFSLRLKKHVIYSIKNTFGGNHRIKNVLYINVIYLKETVFFKISFEEK